MKVDYHDHFLAIFVVKLLLIKQSLEHMYAFIRENVHFYATCVQKDSNEEMNFENMNSDTQLIDHIHVMFATKHLLQKGAWHIIKKHCISAVKAIPYL